MNSSHKSILAAYGPGKPLAVVLDDNSRSRSQIRRHLAHDGLEVVEYPSPAEFYKTWNPGGADIVVADWQLTSTEHGDEVLRRIRERDWEVPFVLISGRLDDESEKRAKVLEALLGSGRVRFIRRGKNGIAQVASVAFELLAERDLTLARLIRGLRTAAQADGSITMTSGKRNIQEQLDRLVGRPGNSVYLEKPLSDNFVAWLQEKE